MTMQSNSEFKPAEDFPVQIPLARPAVLSVSDYRSKRVTWIATICLIPIFLFALFIGFICYREAMAYRELNDKLEAIRQVGEPIDDASMAAHFEKTTHKEGTVAWSEAIMLAGSANAISNGLPFVGDESLPRDFRPGVEWPEEPRVAEFLREIRPLFKKIDDADAFPKPVWAPVDFNGFSTTLEVYQETRSLARILNLDASHALFHREGERALKDIRSLQSVSKAFDVELVLVTKLITIAIQHLHKDSITRSLIMDVWNDEQLAELMDQVRQPYDVAKAWKSSFIGQRAMTYAAVNDSISLAGVMGDYNNPLYRLPILPSGKLALLRSYDVVLDISSASANELVDRATVAEKQVMGLASTDYLVGLFFPALAAYAEAFDRDEVLRRLTMTSLAVKRFQLKNNRFPKNLPELTDVGLSERDWTTTHRQAFGYEVDNEIAYVWTYGTQDKKAIPTSRPILTPEMTPDFLWNVVSIR